MHHSMKEIMPDNSGPDYPVKVYAKPSDLLGLLDATRTELTKMLLDLLPGK